MIVVGFGHSARVGKDTAAEILVAEHGFVRIAFADALRAFVYETFADVRRQVNVHGWEAAKVAVPGVRQTLIDVGNAARRNMGEDVWVDAVFRQFVLHGRYVIPDVRYPNEVKRILLVGGLVVKITRPGIEPGKDVADQALARFDGWSAVVENDGTIDELAGKLAGLVEWL